MNRTPSTWSPDEGQTVRVRWHRWHGRERGECVRDITGVIAGKRLGGYPVTYILADGREFDLAPQTPAGCDPLDLGTDIIVAEPGLIAGRSRKDDLRAEFGIWPAAHPSALEPMPAEEYAAHLRGMKSAVVTLRISEPQRGRGRRRAARRSG